MKRKLIKQTIEKYLKKYIKEFKDLIIANLDYSIKEETFMGGKGMCFSIDGNVWEGFSYDGTLFKYYGSLLEDEIRQMGYNIDAYDQCHWDITED